ncbi:MAG: UDP-N-acetylmuramyl peptide synthase [Bifidobacteriaceae bacterium]|nr:UDP-N-acetylmuramyl peptide synthase [Bifidobacteriaceae bacterium]
MSIINKAISKRITLGYLVENYGFDLVPEFASEVTVTSIATTVESVRQGSLYVPNFTPSLKQIQQAYELGAYALLVPRAMKMHIKEALIPVLYADISASQLGILAGDVSGDPSKMLAVFAVTGDDDDEINANVIRLAEFLHMLGNPVGVISALGTTSMNREMPFKYPVNMVDVQYALSVFLEDGVSAAIIAMNEQTLKADSLQNIHIDVIGNPVHQTNIEAVAYLQELQKTYGFIVGKNAEITMRDESSDVMATQSQLARTNDERDHLSLSIAMLVAAGIKKNNISNALRVARELKK